MPCACSAKRPRPLNCSDVTLLQPAAVEEGMNIEPQEYDAGNVCRDDFQTWTWQCPVHVSLVKDFRRLRWMRRGGFMRLPIRNGSCTTAGYQLDVL